MMTANSTPTQWESVQQKLKLLLSDYAALRKENTRLNSEISKLQEQLGKKDELIQQLKEERDLIASGIQQWSSGEKKLFRAQIDQHLKEIEKCLALIEE